MVWFISISLLEGHKVFKELTEAICMLPVWNLSGIVNPEKLPEYLEDIRKKIDYLENGLYLINVVTADNNSFKTTFIKK